MSNDKPTSLRMGFGHHQARAAGLGGVPASRSPRQVNKIIKESKSKRQATALLRMTARVDPEWIPLIQHRISEGQTTETIYDEIRWIEHYAWMNLRKRP